MCTECSTQTPHAFTQSELSRSHWGIYLHPGFLKFDPYGIKLVLKNSISTPS